MENWVSIIGVLFAALIAIILPLIARRRKKEEATSKIEELYRHLREDVPTPTGQSAERVSYGNDRSGFE